MKKICLTCKQELNLHLFHKDKTGKDGLRGSCKDCTSKNKDKVKIKERMKQRRVFIQQTGNLEYWKNELKLLITVLKTFIRYKIRYWVKIY